MSAQGSGWIFCCCLRPQSSSSRKAPLSEKYQEEIALDHGEVVCTNIDTFTATSGYVNPENVRVNLENDGSEGNGGTGSYQCQNTDMDTLVLPTRLKKSPEVENDDVGNDEIKEGAVVSATLSCEDDCPVPASVVPDQSVEYIEWLEGLVQRLESVADTLEERAGSGDEEHRVKTLEMANEEVAGSGVGSDGPSSFLEDGHWKLMNHSGDHNLTIHVSDASQRMNIFNCENCVIQIEGKADSISIDNCRKCGVVFRDVVSSINVADSERIKIQILGIVPFVHARNTDGLCVYLSHESRNVPIVTFKCSELNFLLPSEEEIGDFKEISVPEQFRSHWNGVDWVTEVADIVM